MNFRVNLKLKLVDFILLISGGLAYWYSYYCFQNGIVSLKQSEWVRAEEPIAFYFALFFIFAFGTVAFVFKFIEVSNAAK